MRNAFRTLCIGAILASAVFSSVHAQFGQVPMRTNPELGKLYRMSTGRLDIIYYKPIEELARFVVPMADSCIGLMERKYQHRLEPSERVTVHMFAGQEDYRQFWVFPLYPTPPSSGVTEGLKRNIAVSFDANASRLNEIVCHEIAHAYQYSLGAHNLPPWIVEGDATFVSATRNSTTEMVVRYIVNQGVPFSLEGYLTAERSIISYYLGSEFWRFLSGDYDEGILRQVRSGSHGILHSMKFGDDLRIRFFKESGHYSSLKSAYEDIYGAPFGAIEEGFKLYLRLRYYDQYREGLQPYFFADVVKTGEGWHEMPHVAARTYRRDSVTSDTVVDVFYLAYTEGYEGIFRSSIIPKRKGADSASARQGTDPALFDGCLREDPYDCMRTDEELPDSVKDADKEREKQEERHAKAFPVPSAVPTRLIRGMTEACETFDEQGNRMDVYARGDTLLLAYVCKDARTGRKALVVFDLAARREVKRMSFDSLSDIRSPSWFPDGRRIAFAGNARSGIADVYSTDVREESYLYRVTDDRYYDGELDVSPDGAFIVFASDRGACGDHRRGVTTANLFLLNTLTREITYLTDGCWIDRAPRWSPDGRKILFASDRSGTFDLYEIDVEGRGRRLTHAATGISSPAWWPDQKSVLFTAFDGSSRIYRMDLPADSAASPKDSIALVLADRQWTPTWSWEANLRHPLAVMAKTGPLPTRFHLTFSAVSGASVLGFGNNTNVSTLFSTLENSKLIYTQFFTAPYFRSSPIGTRSLGRYRYMNAEVGYLDLTNRLFKGVNCYRIAGLYINDVRRNIYGEDRIGCGVMGIYPFSTFRRAEVRLGLEYSDRADYRDLAIKDFNNFRDYRDSITYTRRAALVRLGAEYVSDKTLWAPWHPIDGVRYRVGCDLDADVGHGRADAYSCSVDYRKYFRRGTRSAIATRLYGYASGGFAPRRENFDWMTGMKLYPLFSLYGDRMWMANIDYRLPLIEGIGIYIGKGGIMLPPWQASLFVDAGQAWLGGQSPGPVWGDAGVRLTTHAYVGILSLNYGRMFTIGGGENIPPRYRGSRFSVTFSPNF